MAVKITKIVLSAILVAVGIAMLVIGAGANYGTWVSVYAENNSTIIFSAGRWYNSSTAILTPYPNADLKMLDEELRTEYPSDYAGYVYAQNILSSKVNAGGGEVCAPIYLAAELLIQNNTAFKKWTSDYPLMSYERDGYVPILAGGSRLNTFAIGAVVTVTVYSDVSEDYTEIAAKVVGHIQYLNRLPEHNKSTNATIREMEEAFIIMPDPLTLNAYFEGGRKDILTVWKNYPKREASEIYSDYGTDIKMDFATDSTQTVYPAYYSSFYKGALIGIGAACLALALAVLAVIILNFVKKHSKKAEVEYEQI